MMHIRQYIVRGMPLKQYNNDQQSRQALVDTLVELANKNLNKGTSGNVSASTSKGMLTPSSEWQMHADVYRGKPEVSAVVHCHSPYATILACARKEIPAMHYIVAAAGGYGIPLAGYATFGSKALSAANLEALSDSMACLLANHGHIDRGRPIWKTHGSCSG